MHTQSLLCCSFWFEYKKKSATFILPRHFYFHRRFGNEQMKEVDFTLYKYLHVRARTLSVTKCVFSEGNLNKNKMENMSNTESLYFDPNTGELCLSRSDSQRALQNKITSCTVNITKKLNYMQNRQWNNELRL